MQITTAKRWVLIEQLITHLEKKDIILLKFHLTISEHCQRESLQSLQRSITT
jgi:polyphosphate kinase 2 (PPK2 family)